MRGPLPCPPSASSTTRVRARSRSSRSTRPNPVGWPAAALGALAAKRFDCDVKAYVSLESGVNDAIGGARMEGYRAGYEEHCALPDQTRRLNDAQHLVTAQNQFARRARRDQGQAHHRGRGLRGRDPGCHGRERTTRPQQSCLVQRPAGRSRHPPDHRLRRALRRLRGAVPRALRSHGRARARRGHGRRRGAGTAPGGAAAGDRGERARSSSPTRRPATSRYPLR